MQDFKIPDTTISEMAKIMGIDAWRIESANPLQHWPVKDAEGNMNISVEGQPGAAHLSFDAVVDGRITPVKVEYHFEPEQGGVVGPSRNLNDPVMKAKDPFAAKRDAPGPQGQDPQPR